MSICGLDFGTSNTTLGTIEGDAPVLTALEAGQTTIPSAIFYETDGAVLIGRKAIESYVEGAPGPADAQPQIGARDLADRGDHVAGTRADQLSRRHRLLSGRR